MVGSGAVPYQLETGTEPEAFWVSGSETLISETVMWDLASIRPRVPSQRMPVEIDIAKVARLARLGLSEEELAAYGAQLQDILEHAARVQALPTEGVAPTAHPLPMVNNHRSDEIEPTLDREEVLAQAPDHTEGFFRVPAFLEDS